MDIHQILIRPVEKAVIVLYVDAAGNRNSMVLDDNTIPGLQAVVAACREKLPSNQASPFKDKIEREIAGLEARLSELRRAVGTV
jgi:hypothetical protein